MSFRPDEGAQLVLKAWLQGEEVPEHLRKLLKNWLSGGEEESLFRFFEALGRLVREREEEGREIRGRLDRIINLYFLLYQIVLLSRHAAGRREFLQALVDLVHHSPLFRLGRLRLEDTDWAHPEDLKSADPDFPYTLNQNGNIQDEALLVPAGEFPAPYPSLARRYGVSSWLLIPLYLRGWTAGLFLLGLSRTATSEWERVLLLEELPEVINSSLEAVCEKRAEEGHLFDALTGLPSEGYFLILAGERFREARGEGRSLVMLAIGVDRLVHVNQAFGFRAGDEMLKAVAQRLRGFLPQGAEVARGRSETFYALVPEPEDLEGFLRRLRESLAQPVTLGDLRLELTVSVGVARFPFDATSPGALLRRARTALHEAKRLGGNRTAFFSEDLHRKARTFLVLLPRLRRAIEKREFVVYCQPRLDLKEKRLCGGEILVRWEDPRRGIVPPQEFIWVLEESGLITELGLWVAEETCRILLELPQEMFVSLNLSFNVSPRQLWGSDFVPRFLEILRRYRLCPSRIKIEITENVFIERTEEIIGELLKLSSIGVRVVLDDFGTGYSSLHYLARLPVHDIKIDRTFVSGLPHSESHLEIVRAIIALARALGKRVVAEGVETVEQLKCVQKLGVDEVQGFLFSPPVPWSRFKPWLRELPQTWRTYLEAPSACFRGVEEKCRPE